jgi:hypothetical protein
MVWEAGSLGQKSSDALTTAVCLELSQEAHIQSFHGHINALFATITLSIANSLSDYKCALVCLLVVVSISTFDLFPCPVRTHVCILFVTSSYIHLKLLPSGAINESV